MGRIAQTGEKTAATVALAGLGAAGLWLGWRAAQKLALRQRNRNLPAGQRIVILGGGFAGAAAAQELARLLPDADDAQITLIDQNDFMLFTPMLTEAAGGEMDARHVVHSLHSISPRVRFLQARVTAVDLKNQRVQLTEGRDAGNIPEAQREESYDHLVFALGSVTNDHGIPGVREHSIGMKTMGDATAALNRVMGLLERAAAEPDAQQRRDLLTFIVGGGGFSGVETMAALNDLMRGSAAKFPGIQPQEIRTVLVEPGDRLLPEIKAEGLSAYAQKKLEKRGVEMRLKTEIAGAGADYVELKGGERISTRLLIWSGGVRPNPLLESLDAPRGKHGGLVVDATCAVSGHPGLWAMGDCAEIPDPQTKKTYAPTAQNATREGTQAARNIVATLRGEPAQPFVYTPIGELALVGRHSGVAKVYGMHFSGLLAWAMWRAIYWAKMPDPAQRIRILLDWTLDLTFGRNVVEIPSALSPSSPPKPAPPSVAPPSA